MKPPKKIPHTLRKHGHARIDDYYWLNDRENEFVLQYLRDENAHVEKELAHTKELQETLYKEIRGRIKEDDSSVPGKSKDYFYYTRYEKGKQYPLYCRKKGSVDAAEEIILNVNELAKGHKYFQVGSVSVSPNQMLLAYCEDTQGRRIYDLKFKDLATGELLEDEVKEIAPSIEWATDNVTCFYTKQDLETLRANQIFRHKLGQKEDTLVYEEKDETFRCYVGGSAREEFIFISSHSTLTTEYQFIKANEPESKFKLFHPRERELEYHVEDGGDRFFILTNCDGAKNYKVMETPIDATEKTHWKEHLPYEEDVMIEDVTAFKDHLVIEQKRNGLDEIRWIDRASQEAYSIPFRDETYLAEVGGNREYETDKLRFTYESMTTPMSVIEIDFKTKEQTVRKVQEVQGGFDSNNYESKREHATAPDGTAIPVSLVYRKGIQKNGSNPVLLYGYGSYGSSTDPYFRSSILSLLDRGFIFVIAHIRGGTELGREWYDNGKLLKKVNTFSDFIAAGDYLVAQKYTSPKHLYALGGSAGGLLVGAVMNMRPDLFHGICAAVPFVDVVTTMLDDSIPLTTGEYDEWGNPNEKEYYDYMLTYSPYDNVEAKDYPHLLVTTGLHDSQVQYWEPAKWVAKLRELKTDSNQLLLKTDMDSGHGGASGRFDQIKDTALEYAFFIDLENRKNESK